MKRSTPPSATAAIRSSFSARLKNPLIARSASASRSALAERHRIELRRQDDLQELAVVGVVENAVLDAWRLGPARTGAHHDLSLSLVFSLNPPLEDIDHLEVDVVIVALGNHRRIAGRDHADDVGLHHSVRTLGHAEVAILRVAPQAGAKVFLAVVVD